MKKNLATLLTKEILEYEYENCKSMQKMADKLNVSIDSIYKYMKLYDIKYNAHYTGIHSCNKDFFSTDTEHSFYWAGFIAADGSIQNRKHSKILKITLSNNDQTHLEKFKKSLQSDHIIYNYIVKPSTLVKSTNKSAEIQITSNKICEDLKRFNIVQNKTKIYSMPDWLINHNLINHFMRGYFDGDGCISKCGLGKNRTVLQGNFNIVGTKKFVEQYRDVLIKTSGLTIAKVCEKGNIFSAQYSGNNNIKNIYDFLYKDFNICLDRKYNSFQKYISL